MVANIILVCRKRVYIKINNFAIHNKAPFRHEMSPQIERGERFRGVFYFFDNIVQCRNGRSRQVFLSLLV